ncbi:hypothetical protein YC2023_007414 [Brassica napus]
MIAIKLECHYKMTSESNLTTRKDKINIRKMGSEYCFALFRSLNHLRLTTTYKKTVRTFPTIRAAALMNPRLSQTGRPYKVILKSPLLPTLSPNSRLDRSVSAKKK